MLSGAPGAAPALPGVTPELPGNGIDGPRSDDRGYRGPHQPRLRASPQHMTGLPASPGAKQDPPGTPQTLPGEVGLLPGCTPGIARNVEEGPRSEGGCRLMPAGSPLFTLSAEKPASSSNRSSEFPG